MCGMSDRIPLFVITPWTQNFTYQVVRATNKNLTGYDDYYRNEDQIQNISNFSNQVLKATKVSKILNIKIKY